MHIPGHFPPPSLNVKFDIDELKEIGLLDEINAYLELPFPFPFPGPVCTSCPPFDFSNQSFHDFDLSFSSGDPNPQPSTNNFDDVSQNVELVGDLSLADSFDIFG